MNPKYSQGMRGVVSCDGGTVEVLRRRGVVNTPLPDFPTIQKTNAIW